MAPVPSGATKFGSPIRAAIVAPPGAPHERVDPTGADCRAVRSAGDRPVGHQPVTAQRVAGAQTAGHRHTSWGATIVTAATRLAQLGSPTQGLTTEHTEHQAQTPYTGTETWHQARST